MTLKAVDSDFAIHALTNNEGVFKLPQAPIGIYKLTVTANGFETTTQDLTIASGTNPIIHVPLAVGVEAQTVVVNGGPTATDSVTPTSLVTSTTIAETPGADRTLGTEMITDYVPGAYMTHDMLHMRGGHQTSWLIDGVAIPNTKIASNVGPQIDPKDIDSMEGLRGSYSADLGDRTYGMFNVLPRNGFEFNRERRVTRLRRKPGHRRGATIAGQPLREDCVVHQRGRAAFELRAGNASAARFITTQPIRRAGLHR